MLKSIILITIFIILNAKEPISPIPLKIDYDKEKALLGKSLFFDPILSKDKSTSCLSCHNVFNGGADARDVSLGFAQRKGNIQSPTVLNARYNFVQFWNGRAENLKEQADGPLNNPAEHNMNKKSIEQRLNNSLLYKKEFKKVFGVSYIKYDLILEAIVEFEKALTTPNSKFDRYLKGEDELTKDEQKGYKLFKHYGCITCHNGINIGGNSFQKMGIFVEYSTDKKYPDRSDVTHDISDKNVFKVPSLRNIQQTAPYFHDASAKDLQSAIQAMSKHNLGIIISDDDINSLVKFLESLTGEQPKILDEI